MQAANTSEARALNDQRGLIDETKWQIIASIIVFKSSGSYMHTLRFLPLDTGRLGGGTSRHPNPAVRGWAWVQPWISTARDPICQINLPLYVVGLTPKNAAEKRLPHWFVMGCSQGQDTFHAIYTFQVMRILFDSLCNQI